MKKHLFIVISIILSLTSCSYTPEERAEKVIKEYISAIKDGDYEKVISLTYDRSQDEVCVEDIATVDPVNETLVSNLQIDVKRQCVIGEKDKIEIKSIALIYGSPSPDKDSDKAVEFTDTLVADTTIVVAEELYTPMNEAKSPSTDVKWPSDIAAAYKVVASSANNEIVFTVVQLDEKTFKIFSTKGLYTYNINDISKKIGCVIELADADDDDAMERNVMSLVDNLKTFDIFSKAIASNDTSKITRIFPLLNDYDYQLSGIPTPKRYTQNKLGEAIIMTSDSLKFEFSSSGFIADSYGVISTKAAEEAVKALGETPRNRDGDSDMFYISMLMDQAESIKSERERQAKAAKYKAQGVALVSSRFTNNGNGAKGVEYSALNTSNKTAKYIIMDVVGYNSVDDPVWSDGYIKRCRGIGPIEPGEGGIWDFNDLWECGDLVRSYEIKALIIQFTDGTSKTVKLPRELPSDWRDWLY